MPTVATRIGVLVVDDHPLLRAGLADTIVNELDMRIVGEAANGLEALEAYARVKPDVTIMDIAMPQMDGVQALQAIRASDSAARIVMLTTFKGDAQISRAIQHGAAGFLLKSSVRKDLLDTIRAVHAGKRCIPSEIAQELARHLGGV